MTEVIKVENCGENIGDYDVPIYKAILIPKNATNGDMIKAMFPDCEVNEHKVKTNSQGDIVVGYDVFLYAYRSTKSDMGLGFGIKIFFDNMWWNAPYKAESEVQDANSN